MDQMLSGEQDLEVDIEAQVSTSDVILDNEVLSENVSFNVSETDDLIYPLMENKNTTESLELSAQNVKLKKSRKASKKPPRPPKSPSMLSENDHKVMREIAELAMKKRARIERMKNCLRRIKAAKSSSSSSSSQCISIFSMIVTILFFGFLVFQGIFASNSNLSSEKSPSPIVSPNNQMISVQYYNEFAPVQQTDPSPSTSFRYNGKRISGGEEEENSRDVTR